MRNGRLLIVNRTNKQTQYDMCDVKDYKTLIAISSRTPLFMKGSNNFPFHEI